NGLPKSDTGERVMQTAGQRCLVTCRFPVGVAGFERRPLRPEHGVSGNDEPTLPATDGPLSRHTLPSRGMGCALEWLICARAGYEVRAASCAQNRRYRAGLDDGSNAFRDRYRLGRALAAAVMGALAGVPRWVSGPSSPDS